MGNVFANLPLPVGVGAGASVDTSAMGRTRTFTASGVWEGMLTVEGSNDGGADYLPIKSFANPGQITLDVAVQFMRVVVEAGGDPGTANVDVASSDAGVQRLNLSVTAGDGTGASVDVSALGTFNSLVVTGDFTGQLDIQISLDNVSWESIGVLTKPDILSREFTAQFMRIVRSQTSVILPPGTGEVDVGAANDAPSVASLGNEQVFLYTQPLAPDDGSGGAGTNSDFFVPLPAARATDAYMVVASCVDVTQLVAFSFPNAVAADRTTTQFHVVLSGNLDSSDTVLFRVIDINA